jgi:hypothetical protein
MFWLARLESEKQGLIRASYFQNIDLSFNALDFIILA